LIFVLQSASAAFTPAFQTTIPDILGDEAQYTRALSLSWLAYDLANLASPMLAAALLLLGLGQGPTFAILAGLAVAAALLPPHLWPARDPEVVLHEHRNLPPEDTHLQGAPSTESGWQHAHAYVIDDRHPSWPAGEPAAVTRRR
jgi:hypothetical protein